MRGIILIVIIYICILSGCAKKSDNTYMGIEEKDVTETYVQRQTKEKTTDSEYSIDKQMVKFFIDDSHFYDSRDGVDFAGFNEKNENYHVKILNAYTSDNLEDFGEYFCSDSVKGEIEEMKRFCVERMGYEEEDLTYMCVKVEITNNSSENVVLPMGNSFKYRSRINDIRGQEFGLANMRVEYDAPYSEFWYDSTKKESGAKSGYYLLLQAGETETTNIVYISSKKSLKNDLYLCLHEDDGEYNEKYKCEFPPTSKTTKFLKINLQDNNID